MHVLQPLADATSDCVLLFRSCRPAADNQSQSKNAWRITDKCVKELDAATLKKEAEVMQV